MKKTKMQKLMRSTTLILQGRRILALLLVAVMVFSVFGIAGLGGVTEEEVSAKSKNYPTSTGKKRVVLDTFDEMREYKKNLNKELGDADNPIMILEVVPTQSCAEIGYFVGGCEPIEVNDPLVRKKTWGALVDNGLKQVDVGSNVFVFDDEEKTKYATEAGSDLSQHVNDTSVTDAYAGVEKDADDKLYVKGYFEKVADGKGVFVVNSGVMKPSVDGDNKYNGNYVWHSFHGYDNEQAFLEIPDAELTFDDTIEEKTALGERIYTTRYLDDANYEVGGVNINYNYNVWKDYRLVKNKETFLRDSLGYTKEEAEDTSVIIKTITVEELNAEPRWVGYADLIYINAKSHDGNYRDYWEKYGKVSSSYYESHTEPEYTGSMYAMKMDITATVAYSIFKKVCSVENYAGLILDAGLLSDPDDATCKKNNLKIKVYDYRLRELKKDPGEEGGEYVLNDKTGFNNNLYKLICMVCSGNPETYDFLYCDGANLSFELDGSGKPTDNFGKLTIDNTKAKIQIDTHGNLIDTLQGTGNEGLYWMDSTLRFVPSKSYINTFHFNQWYKEGSFNDYWSDDAAWTAYRFWKTNQISADFMHESCDGHVYLFNGNNSMTKDMDAISNATGQQNGGNYINGDFRSYLHDQSLDGTNADAIGYILGRRSRSVVLNDEIKILDIEPSVKSEADSSVYDNKYFWEFTEEYAKYILRTRSNENVTFKITHMTTAGLNSNIDDLNSKYDMIYIGLDVGGYTLDGAYPKWNDPNMKEMIITHSGDLLYTNGSDGKTSKFVGGYFTWNDSFTSMSYTDVDEGDRSEYTRFGANDITSIKYNALLAYADAGMPIVCEAMLYDNEDSNYKKHIDMNSYIYKLVEELKSDNKLYRFDARDSFTCSDPDAIRAAINDNPMQLVEVTARPKTYNGSVDGSAHFTSESLNSYLTNTPGGIANATWTVKAPAGYRIDLYIDRDQDAKFKLAVTGDAGECELNRTVPSAGTLTFSFPFSARLDVGLQHWMLRIYDPAHPEKYYSEDGYCAVKKLGSVDKKAINVLQVVPKTDSLLNLKTNVNYQKYFNALADYEVNVTVCTLAQFEAVFKKLSDDTGLKFSFDQSMPIVVSGDAADTNPVNIAGLKPQDIADNDIKLTDLDGRQHYMTDFNMLIFGFGDMYGEKNFNNNFGAVDYIKYWIAAGKGILLCHDLTCFRNLDSSKYGYTANYYLRDDMGMNSYGVVSSELRNYSIYSTNTANPSGKYDQTRARLQHYIEDNNIHFTKIYDYNSDGSQTLSKYVQGYAAGNLRRMMSTADNNKMPYRILPGVDGNNLTTNDVQETNAGQITQYPFLVDMDAEGTTGHGFIQVETTHAQYYTVNLEDEYTTVWYTFAAGKNTGNCKMYSANPKDGANNYYIYSKKNVFYSGVGHTETTNGQKVDEVKLFINTMIAAYRAGNEPPEIILDGNDTGYVSSKFYRMNIAQVYNFGNPDTYTVQTLETDAYKTVRFIPRDTTAGSTELTVNIWYEDEAGQKCPVRQVYDEDTGTLIRADNWDDASAEVGIYAGASGHRLQKNVPYIFYYRNKWADSDWTVDSETTPVADSTIKTSSQGKSLRFAKWDVYNNKLPDVTRTTLKISVDPLFVLD